MDAISPKQARRLVLHRQGLLRPKAYFGSRKAGALKAIQRLGYLQIDAINIVQRAHHHSLWSRVPNYNSRYLYELLSKDRKVFEYWSHAAAVLPIENYRFYLPRMQALRTKEKHWYPRDQKLENYILDRIKAEGPLGSKDFSSDGSKKKAAMWDWKPAKKALHELFMQGRVMISKRKNFQINYDLTERVLPVDLDTSLPTDAELFRFKVLQVLAAQGLATAAEIAYLRPDLKAGVKNLVEELTEEKTIYSIQIHSRTYYASSDILEDLPKSLPKPRLHLLSPFDNAIIQRKRVSQLFDFDYQAEIYFPPHKRVYGYFALPILWGDRFIGRMDPKADRLTKRLVIKSLILEPWVKVTDSLLAALREQLVSFAKFNQCQQVEIQKSEPDDLSSALSPLTVPI